MKKLNAIRDARANEIYSYSGDSESEVYYQEGFDAGVSEMQKIVEPLLEILNENSGNECCLSFKLEALQKYKEAIE